MPPRKDDKPEHRLPKPPCLEECRVGAGFVDPGSYVPALAAAPLPGPGARVVQLREGSEGWGGGVSLEDRTASSECATHLRCADYPGRLRAGHATPRRDSQIGTRIKNVAGEMK